MGLVNQPGLQFDRTGMLAAEIFRQGQKLLVGLGGGGHAGGQIVDQGPGVRGKQRMGRIVGRMCRYIGDLRLGWKERVRRAKGCMPVSGRQWGLQGHSTAYDGNGVRSAPGGLPGRCHGPANNAVWFRRFLQDDRHGMTFVADGSSNKRVEGYPTG